MNLSFNHRTATIIGNIRGAVVRRALTALLGALPALMLFQTANARADDEEVETADQPAFRVNDKDQETSSDKDAETAEPDDSEDSEAEEKGAKPVIEDIGSPTPSAKNKSDENEKAPDSEIKPEDYAAYGKSLYWRGSYSDAYQAFREAIDYRPDAPENHYMAGLSLLKSGKPKQSIQYFEKAIKLYSSLKVEYVRGVKHAMINMARAYSDLENYQKVEEISREVMKRFPDESSIYNILGGGYMSQGDYDRAVAIFNDALKINPPNGYTYNNIGLCYLKQSNIDAAQTFFIRAAELIPYSAAFIYNNLAFTYQMQGDKKSALENYRKALSIDAANETALSALKVLSGK